MFPKKAKLILLLLGFVIIIEVIFLFFYKKEDFSSKGSIVGGFFLSRKEVLIGNDYIGLSPERIKVLLAQPENKNRYIIPVFVTPETRIESAQFGSGKVLLKFSRLKSKVLMNPVLSGVKMRTLTSNKQADIQYIMNNNKFIISLSNTPGATFRNVLPGEEVPFGTVLGHDFEDRDSFGQEPYSLIIYPQEISVGNDPKELLLKYKERFVTLMEK